VTLWTYTTPWDVTLGPLKTSSPWASNCRARRTRLSRSGSASLIHSRKTPTRRLQEQRNACGSNVGSSPDAIEVGSVAIVREALWSGKV
jgi:hypothetical protein